MSFRGFSEISISRSTIPIKISAGLQIALIFYTYLNIEHKVMI